MKTYNAEEIEQINNLTPKESVYFERLKLTVTRMKSAGFRVCTKIKNDAGKVIQMTCKDLDIKELG